ncbi:uncharacterized protein METZ01_LOCUS295877, partial [marine metagenome]
LTIRPIEGNSTAALMIEVTSSGYGYLPPGDANTTLADRFVLGSEVNASVDYGGLPPDANATFRVKLGGGIKAISVNAQKAGYGYAVSPSISVSGDGTGALLHPVVKGGRIVDVVVEDPGSGYTTVTLSVSGGAATTIGGWPAMRRPNLQSESLTNAKLSAVLVDGEISRVLIENPGWNYFQPEIVVTGTGSGVEAIPVFEKNETGSRKAEFYYLDYVLVTNPGSGFTEEPWLYQRPEVHMFDYATYRDAPDANTTATIRNWGNPTYVKNAHYPMFQPRLVASLADNFGDRVMEVEITDPGSFHQKGDLNGTLSFNHGRAQDGRKATGDAVFDRVVKSITLKDPKNEAVFIPGTDVKMLGTYGYDKDGNMTTDGALVVDLCSTYLERPEIK